MHIDAVNFFGGAGKDYFLARTRGSTNVSGGSGFDTVSTDFKPFIASTYGYRLLSNGSLYFSGHYQGHKFELFVQPDVEVITDFSNHSLIVSELIRGEVRYLNSSEVRRYEESWSGDSKDNDQPTYTIAPTV